MQNAKDCSCFIRHARTVEERTHVVRNLNYTRSTGDSIGTMILLASLGACPVDATEADE